jgi:predicted DNA-binding transcriptional regulator YafY
MDVDQLQSSAFHSTLNTHLSTTVSNPTLARTPYRTQIRMARINQMMLEQQEHDNGVTAWLTTEKIAIELEDSVRTISEAIKRMREEFGIPIHYVEKRKGIGYTEKVTSLPTFTCSQSESMGLCVGMLGLSLHAGTPYAAGARSIAKKLTAGLRKELAVEFEALEKAVSFHCIGADANIKPVTFAVITPAIIYHQELEIEYAKIDDSVNDGAKDADPGRRRVEPLHLACIDQGWYLLAWDRMRTAMRTFALRRIRQIRMTGTTFKPRRFNVTKHLKHSFGAFSSGTPETIRLRFWGRAAGVVPEFLWHPTQAFEQVPGHPDMIDITMTVSRSPRLIGWIGEWLGEVAVLEPVPLRDEFRDRALKAYEDQLRVGADWDSQNSSSSPS